MPNVDCRKCGESYHYGGGYPICPECIDGAGSYEIVMTVCKRCSSFGSCNLDSNRCRKLQEAQDRVLPQEPHSKHTQQGISSATPVLWATQHTESCILPLPILHNAVAVDFDGVANLYTGWQGKEELFDHRPGFPQFLIDIHNMGYSIVIHSTRDPRKLRDWFNARSLRYDLITIAKPIAIVYIDDRAIKFNGNYLTTALEVKCFKTYWESTLEELPIGSTVPIITAVPEDYEGE